MRLEFILNISGSSIFSDTCPLLGIRKDMRFFLEVRSYVILKIDYALAISLLATGNAA